MRAIERRIRRFEGRVDAPIIVVSIHASWSEERREQEAQRVAAEKGIAKPSMVIYVVDEFDV